jgi:hypothetical protein
MSNTLTNIMPKILARAVMTLREQCVMPRLVNGDYSSEAAKKGTTIDVPIPSGKTASDVTPSNTPPSPADTTPKIVQVSLDQWKSSDFHLSDKDLVEIDKNAHFIPMEMAEAIRALANAVNDHIFSYYTGVYGFTGTAAVTPFASTVTAATNARKIMNQQRAPRTLRRGVLDYDAEANALALSPFADADKTLSAQVKIEGEIGRKYGIDWVADDAVPTHTAGTLAAIGAVIATAKAAGASTIQVNASNGSGYTLVAGDVFTIAGDTQTYVVQATVTGIGSATKSAVTIDPPLAAAVSSEAVTIQGDHVVNMVFHRDAFAFANRPLVGNTQSMALGSQIMSMTDPQTGITLRLEVSRQYKQVVWEFDILWGAQLVRPELATRILG